ncbi:MAG: hypothetical protein L6R28_24775 [Planctomycetes bacterium]|nr:hypothetical protein [Planctomycetota bacterium]
MNLAASAGLTALTLWYSYHYGRLAFPPGYDDVVYMMDGLRRMRLMQDDGWMAVWQDAIDSSTHSPFSIYFAFTSFLVFGPHDWAPYAANGLLVFGLLLGVDALCTGRPWWERLLVNAYVLTVPMTMYGIHEFRPDIPNAWWMTLGLIIVLQKPLHEQTRLRQACAGLAIAAALLTKPSASPMTVLLSGLVLAIRLVNDRLDAGSAFAYRPAFRRIGAFMAWAILPAVPFYAVHGTEELAYIYNALYGDAASLGDYTLSALRTIAFYLVGSGGRIILGTHLILWALLIGLAAIYCLHRKRFRDLLAAWVYALPVSAAYGIATVNHIKTQFLGMAFHALLLGTVLLLICWGLREMEAHGWPARRRALALAVLLTLGLACAKFPPSSGARDAANIRARRATIERLVESLREEDIKPSDQIFFTSVGNAHPEIVLLRDLQAELPVRTRIGTPLSVDLERYRLAMDEATWVVAGEPGAAEFNMNLLCSRVLDKTLAMVRARPDFKLTGSVRTYSGKYIYVYRRIRPANQNPDMTAPMK